MNKIRKRKLGVIIAGNMPSVIRGTKLLESSIAYVPNAMRVLTVGDANDGERLDRVPNLQNAIVRFCD